MQPKKMFGTNVLYKEFLHLLSVLCVPGTGVDRDMTFHVICYIGDSSVKTSFFPKPGVSAKAVQVQIQAKLTIQVTSP